MVDIVLQKQLCFEELSLLWRADFLLVNLMSDRRDSIRFTAANHHSVTSQKRKR